MGRKKAERQRNIQSLLEKLDRLRDAELVEGINPYREGSERAQEWDDARKSISSVSPRRRGAPRGNRNAFRHGRYTGARLALLAQIPAHIKLGKTLIEDVHSNLPQA